MISIREFVEDLKKRGYNVEFNAQIKGRSGLTHHVDGLATYHAADGSGTIIWIEKRKDETVEIIQAFAMAYDAGAEACYVVDGDLGNEEQKLVEFYKMKLLTKI